MLSHRVQSDRLASLANALDSASIDGDEDVLFQAADYVNAYEMTAFDGYQAGCAGGYPIISSDRASDALDSTRVTLEPAE